VSSTSEGNSDNCLEISDEYENLEEDAPEIKFIVK